MTQTTTTTTTTTTTALESPRDLSFIHTTPASRSVVCGACEKPSLICTDERSGKTGYVCRDHSCPGSRVLAVKYRS